MNAIGNEPAKPEELTSEIDGTEDDLVEVGAVSETRGGNLGVVLDLGNGYSFF
jgi:hypothetical protein